RPPTHPDKIVRYAVPQIALVLSIETDKKLTVSATSPTYPQESIIRDSCTAILHLFSQSRVSPHRLVYISAGSMFQPQSPLPYGGSKTKPGYIEYTGNDVDSLLWFMVSSAFKWYWGCRGRTGIDFLTHSVNHTVALHDKGDKDFLDELLLKGMKKAGHIEWSKAAVILENLRFVPERVDRNDFGNAKGVLFTPARRKILADRGNGIVE
ncbi:hypothetical protein HDU81_003867, partial [Chytriomyces hyalinus]